MAERRKELSTPVKLYLILYNAIQLCGWFFSFVQLVRHIFIEGKPTSTLWDRVGSAVYFFQVISFLEVLHALFRLVPSNALITLLQVFGRSMVVVAAIDATPTGKLSPGVPLAVFCWSLAETVRYSYYLMYQVLPKVPHFFTWLRYTMFIPLYPGGFTGELLCVYWAQSYIGETDMWSVSMPNPCNFTFSFFYFTWIMALAYIPIFPMMYLHVFGQRRKALGGATNQQKVKWLPFTAKNAVYLEYWNDLNETYNLRFDTKVYIKATIVSDWTLVNFFSYGHRKSKWKKKCFLNKDNKLNLKISNK